MGNNIKTIIIVGLALSLVNCKTIEGLSKEDYGTAIGAITGAAIGNNVSDDNRALSTVLGTAGGAYLGKVIGRMLDERDQQRLTLSTQETMRTGEAQRWHNPDTGVTAETSVKESSTQKQQVEVKVFKGKVTEVPPLNLIGEEYRANKKVNVRGGPGTDYVVVDELAVGEHTNVVGEVIGKSWYMVSRGGVGSGFVYSSLLTEVPLEDWSVAETEESIPVGVVDVATVTATRDCRVVTQEITLENGESAVEEVTACRGPNGWEIT